MNDVAQSAPLASRGRRLLATAIDAILVPAVTLLLVMLTGVVEDAEDYVDNGWILHVLLLAIGSYLLLNGYTLWRTRQTLGKRIMGIALAGAAGATVSWWRLVVVRAPFFALMYLLLVPPLALVPLIDHLMIFGKRRRCLHDRLAGTEVVRVVST